MLATNTRDAVASDVKAGASRIGNDVRQTANNVRRDINQPDLEGIAHDIGQKVHDYVGDTKDRFYKVSDELTSEIRSRPVQSSLVALGVGFLVGLLVRR